MGINTMENNFFITDCIPTVAELRKSAILNAILYNDLYKNDRHFKPTIIGGIDDKVYLNELYAEGYIEKPDVPCNILRLTKEGIKLCSIGGYLVMVYDKFKEKKDAEELKALDLKIKEKQLENLQSQISVSNINPHKILTSNEFEALIQGSESAILDFKKEMYDFENDDDKLTKIGKFIKDIVSFTNTIRTETAYIIIGVAENSDGSREFVGLNRNIDDAILQAKIKDKVFPVPIFSYNKYVFGGKNYGVFSFPVVRYEMPILPIVKMNKLELGTLYYRLGSTNEKANSMMVIQINDWIKNVPVIIQGAIAQESISHKVTELLKKATDDKVRLSELFSEALAVAKKYNFNELIEFCSDELKGVDSSKLKSSTPENNYKYRIQQVAYSFGRFQPNREVTSTYVKDYLKSENNYFELPFSFSFSITEIESYIERCKGDTSFSVLDKKIKQILPDFEGEDYGITIYFFYDNYLRLYKNIRQKLIECLISIESNN